MLALALAMGGCPSTAYESSDDSDRSYADVVEYDDLVVSMKDLYDVEVGESISSWEVHVTGGKPPYAYEWSQSSGSSCDITRADSANCSISFQTAGTFKFKLRVEDDRGKSATAYTTVTVSEPEVEDELLQLAEGVGPDSSGVINNPGTNLKVGHIVHGAGENGTGFIRRVTRVSRDENGTITKAYTEQVYLADVLPANTHVRASTRCQIASAGVPKLRDAAATYRLVDFSDETLYENSNVRVYFSEGWLDFTPEVTVDCTLGAGLINTAVFEVTGSVDAALVINAEGTAGATLNKSINLNDIFNNKQPWSFPLSGGVIHGVVNVWLYAGIEGSVSGTATAEAGARADASLTMGASYEYGEGWEPISEFNHSWSQVGPTFDLSGSLHGRVYIYPKVEVMLYSTVGPYLEVEPSLNIDAEYDNYVIDWELSASVAARCGGRLVFFGHELGSIGPFDLFEHADTKYVIKDGQIDLTPPPDPNDAVVEVYRTITSTTREIDLRAWDHSMEDGDRIDILVNGYTYRSNLTLTNSGTTVGISLRSGHNTIDIKALNEGTSSPNTAAFSVTDDDGNKLLQEDWHMYTGEVSRLIVIYSP
ncbi:MAG: PKD domain-containing protein [Phycisphaerae bacterium]|nr:PKD domain-containing protein [Phycisphaerae bacterium]